MSCCPPKGPYFDPPEYIYQDFYYPQPVKIVHPIEIINRHHCVPVPYHVYTVKMKDVYDPHTN